jgi:hypothetical protein
MTRFESMATQRVMCALGGNNPLQGSQAFSQRIDVVFIAPNGSVKLRAPLTVSAGVSEPVWTAMAYWGADRPGTLERGTWQVEVWSGSTKLRNETFAVY